MPRSGATWRMALGMSFRSSLWRTGRAHRGLRGAGAGGGIPGAGDPHLRPRKSPRETEDSHLVTPICREMVSQVMVSQGLPAERRGGSRSGRWASRNPLLVAKRPSIPQATGPQVFRDAQECCLCWWGN